MVKNTPEELEKNLASITDSHKLTDDIQKGNKVVFFRCAGSGLYFPGDYLENWGREYGIGLGERVVSECLETDWNTPLTIPKNLQREEQIMYSMKQGGHSVDAYILSKAGALEALDTNMAVLAKEDPFYAKRAVILRNKQLKNPNGRLRAYLSSFHATPLTTKEKIRNLLTGK